MTAGGGARRMASIASAKMAGLRRSDAPAGSVRVTCSVAADWMDYGWYSGVNTTQNIPMREERGKGRGLSSVMGNGTHHRRPDTRHSHPAAHQSLPFEIHPQPLSEHAHTDLAHRISCLAPEKAAVYRRADDHDPPTGSAPFEVRERGLHGAVEPLDVDALHQLEALHRRVFDGCPPYGTGVVDQDVDVSIFLGRQISQGHDKKNRAGDGWMWVQTSTVLFTSCCIEP